jgi:uncharacterized membrane protein
MKTRFQEQTTSKRRGARITQPKFKDGKGLHIEKTIVINRPPAELFSFWRRLENLPRFMVHLESVTERGDGVSHWVMKTDQGKHLEWDARIIEEKPNEMISWQSLEDADVDNAGSVWFTPVPGAQGTMVRLKMRYNPPGGKLGAAVAKLTGHSAEEQISEDLNRFKDLMEKQAATQPGSLSGANS